MGAGRVFAFWKQSPFKTANKISQHKLYKTNPFNKTTLSSNTRNGMILLSIFTAFIVAVAANVTSRLICKRLDGGDKKEKHKED